MGIREEIEKLRENIGVPLASTYNSALDDVLSILDGHLGGCVTEYEFKAVGLLRLVLRGETKRLIGGLTGDHVSVYVRRGDE